MERSVQQQVDVIQDFLESHYHGKLFESVNKGESFLRIDFAKLVRFDPEIANQLLEEPEEVHRQFQLSLKQFDIELDNDRFFFRFSNLPKTEKHFIRNLRSEQLGKLVFLEGAVRQKSDVRPRAVSAKFECPKCAHEVEVAQDEDKLKNPVRCSKCGYKGKFRVLDTTLIDCQGLILEEITTDLDGGEQPKRLKVFLKEDLVSPITDKKTNPGTNLRVYGVLTKVEKRGRDGGKLTSYDFLFEANNIESLSEDYTDIKINKKDEKIIQELASHPNVNELLIKASAPGIYGHEIVKECILLQFLGGVTKMRDDGVKNRGDIHILLIGDPGSGKSQLLKRASIFAPKSRYVSGKGASGAGLTAAVIKDDFMGGWALEAGALVLANKGICMIDELDKMTDEDRSAMHEALEQQTVTISKANIQATLTCQTTVLAAANPKMGRFDPFDSLVKQINLPPALINRFDLIFPFRDVPDEEQDERLASFVLDMHQKKMTEKPEVDTETLRKFIVYARQNCFPQLTDGAKKVITEYYVKMRNSSKSNEGVSAIGLSARNLEALIRLSEAHAKMRLSQKAVKRDAKKAIEFVDYYLSQVGVDPETGRVDIDRIQTGITSSQRNKVIGIREIIKELEEESNDKVIPLERIYDIAQQKGMSQEKVDEAIQKLKMNGDIYEPKRNFISRIV